MKRRIRLTENDLHRVIKESVNKVLNENYKLHPDSPYDLKTLLSCSRSIEKHIETLNYKIHDKERELQKLYDELDQVRIEYDDLWSWCEVEEKSNTTHHPEGGTGYYG